MVEVSFLIKYPQEVKLQNKNNLKVSSSANFFTEKLQFVKSKKNSKKKSFMIPEKKLKGIKEMRETNNTLTETTQTILKVFDGSLKN